MTPFRPVIEGYAAYWEEVERVVLAQVAREVAGLLREQAGLPARGSGVTDDDEAGMLSTLDPTVQTTGVPRIPDDPAARRLLPDASRDDDAVAAEFRHLTQTDLAAAKVRGLERFAVVVDADVADDDEPDEPAEAAEPVEPEGDTDDGDDAIVLVTRGDAHAVAAALTDIRLVLAQRLQLTTDDEVETLHDELLGGDFDDDTAQEVATRRYWGGVFVAAGFAQESLVAAMLDDYRAQRG